jgi:hypothetical protein
MRKLQTGEWSEAIDRREGKSNRQESRQKLHIRDRAEATYWIIGATDRRGTKRSEKRAGSS